MRLSTRGRFAITAMIDLALRKSASPVPLQDLALRHHISLSYLEQVFAKLRQQGLVESTRGPGGGYTLGFRGDTITVADIIGAIEDGEGDAKAEGQRETSQSAQDMTQSLWDDLHSALVAHMKTITLKSLADEQRAKGFQVQERFPPQKGVFQKVKAKPVIVRPNTPNSVFALGNALMGKI
jgi:Rrf2 family transcriptional regulator, iron-sulfur cluster assembly transcription factor